jgi:hypothetical protein
MAMITSIRVPAPVAEAASQLSKPIPRPSGADQGSIAPVAATALVGAVQQGPVMSGTGDPQLLAARTTVETSAAAAAEAAKAAYIRASIAAGINPLPLG